MKLNVKILVCCHKQDIFAKQEPYFPIHVGRALSQNNLDITGDDTGENISEKNSSYCELTGLYWAWKNLKDVDVIGLCHYRRYLDFHHQCQKWFSRTIFPTSKFEELDLSVPQSIIDEVTKGKIIAPKKKNYPNSLFTDYCIAHVSDDLRTLKEIVNETNDSKYIRAFDKVMNHTHKLIHYNMFLMNWKDFDSYCHWLFDILGKVEEKTNIENYTPIQKRIYGYMAERLFNIWLVANKRDVIYKPVMTIKDNHVRERLTPQYIIRMFWQNFSFKMLSPLRNEF